MNNQTTIQLEMDANTVSTLQILPVAALIYNEEAFVYVNEEAINLFEDNDLFVTLSKKTYTDLFINEHKPIITKQLNGLTNKKPEELVSVNIITKNNTEVEVSVKMRSIVFNNKPSVLSIISNISAERKLEDESLRARLAEKNNDILVKVIRERNAVQAKLNTIFNTSSHLIWTVDCNYKLSSFNENYKNVLIDFYDTKIEKGNDYKKLYQSVLNEEDYFFWIDKFETAFKGKNVVFETLENIKSKATLYREVFLNPTFDANQHVVEVVAISHDITERKVNELKALEQSAKLNAMFESGDQLMWTVSKTKKITSFNQNYSNAVKEIYNYIPTVNLHSFNEINTTDPFWNDSYEDAFKGKKVEFFLEKKSLKGDVIIRQMILSPIKDLENKIVEVSGIAFDITKNKKNEEKISQSLKEKEILLKEVHHRVKNNMQVISSILNLQSSYVTDDYALSLLKECQNRIKSMAYIHESLYQTKNFESVNFTEYLSTLSKNLIHTYSVNSKKVKLVLNLSDLFLNLDLSIPCGLIINEIISNSLKYAFTNRMDGIIFVNLGIEKGKVRIEVGDNGVGIPHDVDLKQTQTLGMQLVYTLIEQIDGTLELDRINGTKFIIKFKI
jgi:two-component sensor histidine kinase/PAS domain-containing protein